MNYVNYYLKVIKLIYSTRLLTALSLLPLVVYKVKHVVILCLYECIYIHTSPYYNMYNLDGKHCLNTLITAFNISKICVLHLGEKLFYNQSRNRVQTRLTLLQTVLSDIHMGTHLSMLRIHIIFR